MMWQAYLVLTIVAWGGYNILFKFATNRIDFFLSFVIIGTVHALTALPWVIAACLKTGTFSYSMKGIWVSVLMGFLLTIGGWAFFWAFKLGAPVVVATPVYGIGVLLLGALVGVLFVGEVITIRWVIGMVLGITSVLLLTTK